MSNVNADSSLKSGGRFKIGDGILLKFLISEIVHLRRLKLLLVQKNHSVYQSFQPRWAPVKIGQNSILLWDPNIYEIVFGTGKTRASINHFNRKIVPSWAPINVVLDFLYFYRAFFSVMAPEQIWNHPWAPVKIGIDSLYIFCF